MKQAKIIHYHFSDGSSMSMPAEQVAELVHARTGARLSSEFGKFGGNPVTAGKPSDADIQRMYTKRCLDKGDPNEARRWLVRHLRDIHKIDAATARRWVAAVLGKRIKK
jgi:hypothetical protein